MKLFFSWQSDIGKNQNLITCALKQAVDDFNSNFNSSSPLEFDVAMRNTSGAPDICTTILAKIRNADFFVCDITPVVKGKDITNSNVVFELGYAVSFLGWERIILLFNKAEGNLDTQLPFDIKTHNVKTFSTEGDNRNNISSLKKDVLNTLSLVYQKNPPKILLSIDQKKQIEKERDIKKLREVLKTAFCLQIWDNFFGEYPTSHFSDHFTMSFFPAFVELYESTYWYFYDKTLQNYFDTIYKKIGFLDQNINYLFTHTPMGMFVSQLTWNQKQTDAFHKSIEFMNEAQQAYSSLVKYIRENYLEVDIDDLSNVTWDQYVQEQEKIKKLWGKS